MFLGGGLPLLVGLWSYDIAFSFPAWPRTARESPELAQISRPSDVARTTTAVHPEGSLKKLGSGCQSKSMSSHSITYPLADPHPSS
jgi:hypothetical protein